MGGLAGKVFGNKTITDSYVGYSNVFTEEDFNNDNIGILVNAVIKNKSVVSQLRNNFYTGTAFTFERYLKAGLEEPLVMPKQIFQSTDIASKDPQPLIDAIALDTGRTGIDIKYAISSPLNPFHAIWPILESTKGYNPSTNISSTLTASVGETVKVMNLHFYAPESFADTFAMGTGISWANSFNDRSTYGNEYFIGNRSHSVTLDDYVTTPYMEVTFSYYKDIRDSSGQLITKDLVTIVEDIPMPEIGRVEDVIQVFYKYTEGEGYWTYHYDTGTHTEVEKMTTVDTFDIGRSFPVIMLENEGDVLFESEASRETEEYERINAVTSILGMDLGEMTDQFFPEDHGLYKVAIANMVPVTSEDPIHVKYLIQHFTALDKLIQNKSWFNVDRNIGSTSEYYNMQYILDETYSFSSSFYRVITGKFGASYEEEVENGILRRYFYEKPVGTTEVIKGSDDLNDLFPIESSIYGRIQQIKPYIEYRHYTTKNSYEFARVYDPSFSWTVGYKENKISRLTDDDCYVLLDTTILDKMAYLDRAYLVRSTFLIQHGAYDKQKVNNFSYSLATNSVFRGFVTVIMVIGISYLTGGMASSSVASFLSGLGVSGATLVVATAVIESLVMSSIIDIIAKNFDSDVINIFAVAAFIYGGYSYLNQASTSTTIFTSSNLLQASNGLAQASTQSTASERDKIITSMIEENERDVTKLEELESKIKELNSINKIGVYDLLSDIDSPKLYTTTQLGENPEAYYDRTIHSGNVGAMALNIPNNYHTAMLSLPTPDQTLQWGNYHGIT